MNSNDCSVLCISYEKGKKHIERYYIGVKNRATESEYSIKKIVIYYKKCEMKYSILNIYENESENTENFRKKEKRTNI